jgi:hypothetical protein
MLPLDMKGTVLGTDAAGNVCKHEDNNNNNNNN